MQISDEEIVDVIEGRKQLSKENMTQLLDEVLARRRVHREESRLIDQVRRMRWVVETSVQKSEELQERLQSFENKLKAEAEQKPRSNAA